MLLVLLGCGPSSSSYDRVHESQSPALTGRQTCKWVELYTGSIPRSDAGPDHAMLLRH